MYCHNLDRFITIETPTEGSAGEAPTWATFAQVWANKRDVTGRERFAARQELAQRTTVFRTFWLDGLTEKMRIQYDGLTFDIEGIAELGFKEAVDITATAVTP